MKTQLVTNNFLFENEQLDYIVDEEGEVWFSAETIGRALGYKNPSVGVNHIYGKDKVLFEQYTRLIPLAPSEQSLSVTHIRVFNEEGVYLICMRSSMPKAIQFQISVAHLIKDIRKQEKIIVHRDQLELLKLKVREKELTAEIARLENEKIDFEKKKIVWEKEKKITDILIDYSRNYPKQISEESQQALEAQAIIILSPESADLVKNTLPTIQREYTATDISNILWKDYNIEKTPYEIGKIASRLGIKDHPELCRIVPNTYTKEVEGMDDLIVKQGIQFRYSEYAKDMIVKHYANGLVTLEQF